MTTKHMLKCPIATCSYQTVGRGMGLHISGHKRRGELPMDAKVKGIRIEVTVSKEPEPIPTTPPVHEEVTSTSIADALLQQVVDAINSREANREQLKVAKARIVSLEADVARQTDEKLRILKIHNEQAKRNEISTPEELVRLASILKLR